MQRTADAGSGPVLHSDPRGSRYLIRLSYGFCSPELARKIPGRIDPKRDQHAGHERNRPGNLVCDRLGAAVDFVVEDEDMLEVAQCVNL